MVVIGMDLLILNVALRTLVRELQATASQLHQAQRQDPGGELRSSAWSAPPAMWRASPTRKGRHRAQPQLRHGRLAELRAVRLRRRQLRLPARPRRGAARPARVRRDRAGVHRLLHQGLASDPTPFNGRSDYGPFITATSPAHPGGIPAGGLFTGAEGIKTAEQQAIYSGTAGIAYDPCYHQACDTAANFSGTALGQMSDAAAHAVITLADSARPAAPAAAAARPSTIKSFNHEAAGRLAA
jgi:hypothetical protein